LALAGKTHAVCSPDERSDIRVWRARPRISA